MESCYAVTTPPPKTNQRWTHLKLFLLHQTLNRHFVVRLPIKFRHSCEQPKPIYPLDHIAGIELLLDLPSPISIQWKHPLRCVIYQLEPINDHECQVHGVDFSPNRKCIFLCHDTQYQLLLDSQILIEKVEWICETKSSIDPMLNHVLPSLCHSSDGVERKGSVPLPSPEYLPLDLEPLLPNLLWSHASLPSRIEFSSWSELDSMMFCD